MAEGKALCCTHQLELDLGAVRPKTLTSSLPPSISGTSSVASKYEELECLYAAVGKVIYEGLTNYEKATNANPSQLFGECLCALPSSGSRGLWSLLPAQLSWARLGLWTDLLF